MINFCTKIIHFHIINLTVQPTGGSKTPKVGENNFDKYIYNRNCPSMDPESPIPMDLENPSNNKRAAAAEKL